MSTFTQAQVTEVLSERPGLQKLRVRRNDGGKGELAYALTQLVGSVAPGDEVVINTTAVELDLGTGGWHFVHWNLARKDLRVFSDGHQIKLRYTSLQFDTGTAEEGELDAPDSLDGMPVICCELLSQAATAIIALKRRSPEVRVALVMTDDNALPLALSDLIAELVDEKFVETTITAGQAFGGDFEAVTVLSALGIAKSVADVIVVTQGPGSLGTGSRFGFSTLGIASVLDDVHWYGGTPIIAARWSSADSRERHRGLSHHTVTILERANHAVIAVPAGHEAVKIKSHACEIVDAGDVAQLLEQSGVNVTTMGRTVAQDPEFFTYAAAAGVAAASRVA